MPGRDAVVVLGPRFWKSEFAGDPSVVGRRIRLDGAMFTVIGVAPATFPGMRRFDRPDFYAPLAMAEVLSADGQEDFFEDRSVRALNVMARLKPGATLAQARSELAVLARNFATEHPKTNFGRGATVRTRFEMRSQSGDRNWKFSVIF